MTSPELTPEQQKQKWAHMQFERDRGLQLSYHFFGVHMTPEQEHFEQEKSRRNYASEQHYSGHTTNTNYQEARSGNPQEYANSAGQSNVYPPANATTNVPGREPRLSLEYPLNHESRNYMTQSPQQYAADSESMHSSAYTPYTTSAGSTQNQWFPEATSAGNHSNSPQGAYTNSRRSTQHPKHHSIKMYSPTNGWHGLTGTCDPGTDENWISSRIVTRLRLQTKGGLLISVTTFNGKKFESGKTVTVTWQSENRTITHYNEFRVIDNGPFDVLFGRNLLESPEINYFVDEAGEGPALILLQSTVSQQERAVMDRNSAAANSQSRDLEKKERPVTSSSYRPKRKDKKSGSSSQMAPELRPY